MRTTYDDQNLAEHNVSREEVDEVLATDIGVDCDLPPSKRGNQRAMLVAFASEGRLLEVGLEFFLEEDRMHVFHADDATKPYRALFENEVRPL